MTATNCYLRSAILPALGHPNPTPRCSTHRNVPSAGAGPNLKIEVSFNVLLYLTPGNFGLEQQGEHESQRGGPSSRYLRKSSVQPRGCVYGYAAMSVTTGSRGADER